MIQEKIEKLKKKRELKYTGWMASFAIITIPLYTLVFGTRKPPSQYTLSMIGNRFGYRLEFIIWGVITGGLFVFYVLRLFKKANFDNKRAKKFLIWSDVFLVLTVIIPALEEIMPILAFMHRFFGAAFGVSLVLSLYFFIRYLSMGDHTVKRRYLLLLFMVVAGSVFSLFIFGNTGIFEIFFFVSISIFLIILSTFLKRYEKKSKKKEDMFNERKKNQDTRPIENRDDTISTT